MKELKPSQMMLLLPPPDTHPGAKSLTVQWLEVLMIAITAVLLTMPLLAQSGSAKQSLDAADGTSSGLSQGLNQGDRARLAMQASLARQRESAARQLRAAGTVQNTPALRTPVTGASSREASDPPALLAIAPVRTLAAPQFVEPAAVRHSGPSPASIEDASAKLGLGMFGWSGPATASAEIITLATMAMIPAASPAGGKTPADLSCDPLTGNTLTRLIGTAASAYQLDPNLIREVARQESAFRPCSVSRKGAQGLMQLMPATQDMLEVEDPFDPEQSLSAGAKLLRSLLDRYSGDLALALSAYNAGSTRVDQTMAVPQIPETQNYVANIMQRLGVAPR